ncbi:hypothetical protein Tco_0982571 [Tanacetum coccineum]
MCEKLVAMLRSIRYKGKDTLGVVILGVILHKDLCALHLGNIRYVVLSYLVLLIYEVTPLDPYSAATQFGGVTMLAEEVDPENFTRNGGDVQDDIESEEEVEVAFDETTNLRSCTIAGVSTYTAPDASKS